MRLRLLLALFVLLWLVWLTPLHAKRFDEATIQCSNQLIVRLQPGQDDGDSPILVAEAICQSYAEDGTPLRQIIKNIAGDLTANQVQMFTRVLQRLERTVARRNAIPTPLATPTDIVVRTPTPE